MKNKWNVALVVALVLCYILPAFVAWRLEVADLRAGLKREEERKVEARVRALDMARQLVYKSCRSTFSHWVPEKSAHIVQYLPNDGLHDDECEESLHQLTSTRRSLLGQNDCVVEKKLWPLGVMFEFRCQG